MPASFLPIPYHPVRSTPQPAAAPSHGHGFRVSSSHRLPNTHPFPHPRPSLDQATRENATQKLEQASRENYVRRPFIASNSQLSPLPFFSVVFPFR
jgi:hypothetical protein